MMGYCVAIDGPAAAGKGTIARSLAKRLGFSYLDTGLLYRAVARATLAGIAPIDAARTLNPDMLENISALRAPEIAQEASIVAQMPEVRDNLLDFQRAFARREPGAVLDGRDIGTVICPDAAVKLFITASDSARAARHLADLTKQHTTQGAAPVHTLQSALAALKARDRRDGKRALAPMRRALDAHLIDTSCLDIEQSIELAFEIVAQELAI